MKEFLRKIFFAKEPLFVSLFGGSIGVLIGTIYEKYLPLGATLSLIVAMSILLGLLLPPRL